jgi:outer membrane protein assembly factor BamB/subtilisin family serine protease
MLTLRHLALLVSLAATTVAAFSQVDQPPFSAKERAQGFREGFVLVKERRGVQAMAALTEDRSRMQTRSRLAARAEVRVLELAAGDEVPDAVARLRATGLYDFVEPDYLLFPDATPNDPNFPAQWALQNTGQLPGSTAGADIRAVPAWDVIKEAPDVVVAVVDTGVNLTHEDLVDNLWRNPAPTFGDVHGASFVRGVRTGVPLDQHGHGTHVAGIIGAVGNNGRGISGVAWKVQIMAVKQSGADGISTASDSAAAIDYAVAQGAKVINCSFGGVAVSQTLLAAIRGARDAGVLVVTAAGNAALSNDVTPHYPANFLLDNVVTVGNSDARDVASTTSNFGASVDIFAPGSSILSLDITSTTALVTRSGTSMAAPHVTGALALMKARFPEESPRQLINRLLRGADRIEGLAGRAQAGGRLNLLNAVNGTSVAPFNDDFASRGVVVGASAAIRASTVGATTEPGEPALPGGAGATVWWEWKAEYSAPVTLTTGGSDYDTVLAVYRGTALGGLEPVATNDDTANATTSAVTFAAQAGTTYVFAVGGKGGASGFTVVTLSVPPQNDTFASALPLPSAATAHHVGTTRHATTEPEEPRILAFTGATSIWYSWTAPRSGRFQIAAFSDAFDPLLGVYTGDRLPSLQVVEQSDDTSELAYNPSSLVTLNAVAGTTYRIKIASKSTAQTGDVTLTINDSLWQVAGRAPISSTPTVAQDGTVYFAGLSPDRTLYALHPDGSLRWQFSTSGGSIDLNSPAVGADGTVYFGSNDGRMRALTPEGALKWERNLGAGNSIYASPALAADGTVYVHAADGFLYALAPADGTVRWRTNVNARTTYAAATVAGDGTIYQGAEDRTLHALQPDGTRRWQFTADAPIYSEAAIDATGQVYFTSRNGKLWSLTPSGTLRWTFAGPTLGATGSPALSSDGQTVYYGAGDGYLYAVRVTDGGQRWRTLLSGRVISSSPALDASGTVYIGTDDGKVHAVAADGALRQTWHTARAIYASPVIFGNTLYVGSRDMKLYAFDLGRPAAEGPWPMYRQNHRHIGRLPREPLTVAAAGTPVVHAEQPLRLSAFTSRNDGLSYQWSRNGVPLAGATAATYAVPRAGIADAGTYTVTVTAGQERQVSSPIAVTVAASGATSTLANVSFRSLTAPGTFPTLIGFRLVDGSKRMLVRAVGPTLARFGVTGVLPNPQFTLRAGTTEFATHQAWQGNAAVAAAASAVGAFALPADSADAATTGIFSAGTWSVVVSGTGAVLGTTLTELYDLDALEAGVAGRGRLVNISARALVGSGSNALVAGFTVAGHAPKRFLLRGVGPTLLAFGISSALLDPKLELFTGSLLIRNNDDWAGSAPLLEAFRTVGAFPLLARTSPDAAMIVTLPPGIYTAQLSSVSGAAGAALLEIYELP